MTFYFLIFTILNVLTIYGWDFPHYLQCDPQWGNNEMGVNGPGERSTICSEGCAMTDVSMALAGLNLTVYNNISNPGILNTWLINNNGYECLDGDCNNLIVPIISNLTNNTLIVDPNNFKLPSMYDIRRGLDAQDTIYIAHNPVLHHFVLAYNASWEDEIIYVLDPYYNATYYTLNESDYYIIYNIYNLSRKYTYYDQCNTLWGNNIMGQDNLTICEVGCLMTSVSMAMNSYNISINNMITNPNTLNVWLQNNNGYASGTSDLIESSLNNINNNRVIWPSDGMHTHNDISIYTIKNYLQNKPRRVVIANVMEGKHFVLVVDVLQDMDTLLVNDPGGFYNTYSYSRDVVGWRLFDMS